MRHSIAMYQSIWRRTARTRGFCASPEPEVPRELRALAGTENLWLEDRVAVLSAIDAFDKRLDFANALPVHSGARAAGFVTFDRRRAGRAKWLDALLPLELLEQPLHGLGTAALSPFDRVDRHRPVQASAAESAAHPDHDAAELAMRFGRPVAEVAAIV